MKKIKQAISFSLCMLLIFLCSCSIQPNDGKNSTAAEQNVSAPDISNAIAVTLSDDSIKADGNGVKTEGSVVTVTDGGIYIHRHLYTGLQ